MKRPGLNFASERLGPLNPVAIAPGTDLSDFGIQSFAPKYMNLERKSETFATIRFCEA
jgi:hypothetical protein